ncbi:hypothetical protein Ahy_B04g073514 isoform B [Arachis hypogaea]|uniref:CCHC-type domain-containing protein n=1 Tax=Arachis hypogaea TaxID=3818 RepID=A0A444ZQW1_ARAHY|nr:hypothetical protein Ahy_B04g073514 isoform B [Arachis hypogaea]
MDAYRRTYQFNVNPVKGQDLWEKTGSPAPVPPPIKPKPGRPTTNRRKDKDEGPTGTNTKMKRKYAPIRCMYCGEVGHNKRTCSKKKQDDAQEKARMMQLQLAATRKRGRPPKLHVTRARAKGNASPGAHAVSAETIKGSSSATAKKLASFMTFVPTPGFKPPRKKDME